MITEQLDDTSELYAIITDNKIATLSDSDISNWDDKLFYEIEPLKRRYKIFTLGKKTTFSFIIPLFILISFIWSIAGESIIGGLIWILFMLLFFTVYIYTHEYFEFVSKSINDELERMRRRLNSLLYMREELIKERLKKNVIFKRSWDKELSKFQKLRQKLYKEKYLS